ncbi:MAG: DinB family protein [Acidobacteriales bacterium]|nr:DinB family protein [Terriglobales bacterium]
MSTAKAASVWNEKPSPEEGKPAHFRYIDQVPPGDLFDTLARQPGELAGMVGKLDAEGWARRYAPGKWSVLEVVGHLADAERIQAFRAFHIARGDKNPLPGWEENDYMVEARFPEFENGHSLLDQVVYLRSANCRLFAGLDPETILRRGMANNVNITVRSAVWVLAGHMQHHMNILRERYGL